MIRWARRFAESSDPSHSVNPIAPPQNEPERSGYLVTGIATGGSSCLWPEAGRACRLSAVMGWLTTPQMPRS